MTVHYAVDQLTVRDGRFFGWGWLLHESIPARRVELRVTLDDRVAVVECLRAGPRPDLAAAFPNVAHAAGCGFLLVGRVDGLPPRAPATLVAHLEDGSKVERQLPDFPARYVVSTALATRVRALISSPNQIEAVRASLPVRTALRPTVVPCTTSTSSSGCARTAARPASTARVGSSGVDGSLCTWTPRADQRTTSVKVPPVSMPMRAAVTLQDVSGGRPRCTHSGGRRWRAQVR